MDYIRLGNFQHRLYKIRQFSTQNQIQNIIFHSYHFGKSFWNVSNKKLSSFAHWTKKLPGIGCHGEERKFSTEISQNLSKVLSCIHRHKYLCYSLFFVFFIELCAWGKLYSGTPGKYASMQVCKYTSMQVYNYASMQVCKYTIMQLCKYVGIQVCKFINIQVSKYASIHVSKYASKQSCKYASMQKYNYSSRQVCKYTSMQIHEYTSQ